MNVSTQRTLWSFAYAIALAILATPGAAAADEVFAAKTQITLPNGQSISTFDISYDDPVLERYFLSDRTNAAVDQIDTRTNQVTAQLGQGSFVGFTGNNDTSGPNGVLTVNHREVWAGNGDSTVHVIDLKTQQTTHIIPTGGAFRADEGCFDPRNQIVQIANDAEHDNPANWPFISFISTKTYQILGKITMDGTNGTPKATNGIEQCKWSPRTGKIYLNIPEVNGPGNDTVPGAVLVIDPKLMQIVQTYTVPLASCAGPQGMALGPDHQILLGCNAPGPTGTNPTAVIDERNGAVIATLPNESGSDEVWFNPGDDHYFLARSSAVASTQLLGVIDANKLTEDPSVFTALAGSPTAHSVAADPIFNQVYVPIPAAHSTVCSSAGGSDAQGCIAVFTAPHDDHPVQD
jgi:hypothetical protein